MLFNCYPGRTEKPDWNNIDVISTGCLPFRSSLIPFPDLESCRRAVSNHRRYISPYIFLLNGRWLFKYFEKITRLPENILSFKSGFDEIMVPGCWQDQNYGRKLFVGDSFPFPNTPGNTFEDQGIGFYKKIFSLPLFWNGLRKFLVFNGVSQAFHLYINKKLIGFCQQSYQQTAFDITSAWHEGENEISVLVYENSFERYIEYQPPFESQGIFRDVFIEAVPSISLQNLSVQTRSLDSSYTAWLLELALDIHSYRISKEQPKVIVTLSKEGIDLAESVEFVDLEQSDSHNVSYGVKTIGRLNLEFQLNNIKAWSAEQPETYDLYISVVDSKGREQVCYHQLTGFRQLIRKNNKIEINGQPLCLFAVRYRECTANAARSAKIDKIKSDLIRIKSLGLNCIHTIDGPADPILYDLCCLLGIYVIAESDIELFDQFASGLSEKFIANWQIRFENRLNNMVKCGYNCCCIVGWSPGRQLSAWPYLEKLVKYIRKLDNSRIAFIPFSRVNMKDQSHPVHVLAQSGLNAAMLESSFYEYVSENEPDSNGDFKFNPEISPYYYAYLMTSNKTADCDFEIWIDMQSRIKTTCLGAGIIQFRNSMSDTNETACETVWDMKNMSESKMIRRSGWHLKHPVMPQLDQESNSAVDWSSRLGDLLKPLKINTDSVNQDKLALMNLNSFADITDIILNWQLFSRQSWLDNGTVHISEIAAGQKYVIDLTALSSLIRDPSAETTHLNCVISWKNTNWPLRSLRQETNACIRLENNLNNDSAQIFQPDNRFASISNGKLRAESDRHLILISGHRFWLIFNRISNSFESWRCGEYEFFETDAGKIPSGMSWIISNYENMDIIQRQYKTIPLSLQFGCDGVSAVIESRSLLAESGKSADFELTERHEINQNGQLKTDVSIRFMSLKLKFSSDIFFNLRLKEKFQKLQWFGMGPDNDNSCEPVKRILSLHNASIAKKAEMHSGCHWLFCHSEHNLGLMLQTKGEFVFSAKRFSKGHDSAQTYTGERDCSNISIKIAGSLKKSDLKKQLLDKDKIFAADRAELAENSDCSIIESQPLFKTTIILQPLVLK
jgi:beta-galactosidase/beta-glucuronidase